MPIEKMPMHIEINLTHKKLPYHLLLMLSYQIDSAIFDAQLSLLNDLMLADEQVNSTSAWVNFEAAGHPVYWRAAKLFKLYEINSRLGCVKQISIIAPSIFEQDDYIGIRLIQQRFPHINIKVLSHLDLSNWPYIEPLSSPLREATISEIPKEMIDNAMQQLIGLSSESFSAINNQDDAPIIQRALMRYLQHGVVDTGIRLISARLQQSLSPEIQGMLDGLLYRSYFVAHLYERVVTQSTPPWLAYVAKDYQLAYYYIKAYAATLTRKLNSAAKFFSLAKIDRHIVLTDIQSLYKANIFALYLFLSGEAEQALELEQRIEHKLIQLKPADHSIFYINAINQARLYRIKKQLPACRAYYAKAYAAIRNSESESDYVYKYINQASVYASEKQEFNAALCWLAAYCQWQLMGLGEALAWRPLTALIKQGTHPTSLTPINHEELHAAFHHHIYQHLCHKPIQDSKSIQILDKTASFLANNCRHLTKSIFRGLITYFMVQQIIQLTKESRIYSLTTAQAKNETP